MPQTEWMDEHWPGPPEEYWTDISELIKAVRVSVTGAVEAYCKIFSEQAKFFIGPAFQNQEDFVLWPPPEPPLTREEILEIKKHRNHGPRSGQKFRTDGKKKW